MNPEVTRRRGLAVGAVSLACLVGVPVLATGSGSDGPVREERASVKKQLKKLKKRVKKLERAQGEPAPPMGPAGGDLAGEYPAPTIAGGALSTADFSASLPTAKVTRSAGQPVPFNSNQGATLVFDAERYDTAGLHEDSIAPARLTAPVTGIYAFALQVTWAAGPGTFRSLTLLKNGNVAIARATSPPMASGTTPQLLTTQARLEAGEYVEGTVFHDDGDGNEILKQNESSPELAMTWLAPGP